MAVLLRTRGHVECALVRDLTATLGAAPEPAALAELLAKLAASVGARVLALDGPQAWKDAANGLVHQRSCERALATQAKTGPPGSAKPASQLRFVAFSIALFDALEAHGFPRFDPASPDRPSALEVFPTATWRALGARPLPARRRTAPGEIAARVAWLREHFALRLHEAPTHDELQAAVAGFAGLALAGDPAFSWRAHGRAPYRIDSDWREGVIVVPVPANSSR